MSNSKDELCGCCCKGSQPVRKRFNECNVCACGAPFFSQIVVENNLPNSRRCLIEIPTDFIEDHGHRFDKMDKYVIFEEKNSNSKEYRVKIGGNNFVGFGFEWKEFAQSHNIGTAQIIVFTLVRNSRFLVQIYNPGNPSPIAPKVEDDDDDAIEVCVAQDWMAAKASRSNPMNCGLPSKVKVEQVLSQSSTRQATIRKESPAPPTSATEERKEREEEERIWNSSENEEIENSDSSWSPRNNRPRDGRRNSNGRRSSKHGALSGTSSDTRDEDADEIKLIGNEAERRGKRPFSQGRSSIDAKDKRVGLSDMERSCPSDEDETIGTNQSLLVEGVLVKKNGHDWHEAGTKRGRTYVSKRRPVTEAEKQKALQKARQVHINNPSFLKQLHKDSCYRALKLFPPEQFFRENMISAAKGSYKATLEDVNGDTWITRISGRRIFWKHFTLDHNLEEDDVVVFELTNSRRESVTFLVHIFRVVDITKPLAGKAGWALHYNVVEGTKKQYSEERRRLLEAQGVKNQKKQKHKLKDRSSSSSERDPFGPSEFYKSKKDPKVMELHRRPSVSHGRGKPLQKEGASGNEIHPRTIWKRATRRCRSRQINRSFDELSESRRSSQPD